jgi:pseudouridine-5'-phosphate glycosidase
LPAFYSRKSGLTVDETVETAREVAEIAQARDKLNLKRAILLTVPVPEKFEIGAEELEKILHDALRLAEEQKIKGKEITPFLLSQMAEKSAGKTLAANIALLENNAAIAAQVAVEMTKITNEN